MTSSFAVDALLCKDINADSAVTPLLIGNNVATSGDVVIGQKNSRTKIAGALTVNSGSTSDSFTFPNSTGSLHQVLETDGAGNTSWATLSSLNVFDQDLNTTASVQFAEVDIGGFYSLPPAAGTAGQVLQSTGGTTTAFGPLLDYGLLANPLSQFATTTSAQFAGVINGTTGTGQVVFDTSPILVTPDIGDAIATSVDSLTTLQLGAGSATDITIGNGSITTTVDGMAMNVSGRLNASTIDVQNPGSLTIGNLTASSIDIGHPSATTSVAGQLQIGNYTMPSLAGSVGQVLQLTSTTDVSFVNVSGLTNVAFTNQPLSQWTVQSSSADLAGIISDETGTGSLVFANSPSLVTPNIGAAVATSVDASVGLQLGTGTASSVTIGKSGHVTVVNGSEVIVEGLYVNTIDTVPGGPTAMVIGDTNAASVAIGHAGVVTSIVGTSTNVSNRLNASLVDVSSGTLSLGTNTATGVIIGQTGISTVTVGGTLQVVVAVHTSNIDSAGPPLQIGINTPAGIFIGTVGNPTTMPGTLTVGTRINSPLVDVSFGAMSVGTTTAASIAIGKSTVPVTISGYTMPLTSGSLNQILQITSANTASFVSLSSINVAFTTNPLSQFASTTSAQLAGVISDETGTGALVFATSPALTTPNIGAATATSIDASGILALGTLASTTAITIGSGSIPTTMPGTVNVSTRLNSPVVDVAAAAVMSIGSTANGITIGSGAASTNGITIGGASVVTSINGTSTNIGTRLNASTIDVASAGVMTVGAATASAITIGHAGIITTITGTSTNIGTRLNAGIIDVASAGLLTVGAATANAITIGHSGIVTTITGTSTNVGTRLNAGIIDVASAGPMTIGTLTANAITIGHSGVITTMTGTSTDIGTRLNARTIDVSAAGPMTIGASTTNGITIGHAGITTNVIDTLQINSAYTFPTASGASGTVITSQGATSAWRKPPAFIQTFGGTTSSGANSYFLVNGLASTPGIALGIGCNFVVPFAASLTSVAYESSGGAQITFYKNGVAIPVNPTLTLNLGKFAASLAVPAAFVPGDWLTVQQTSITFPISAMITCYFE